MNRINIALRGVVVVLLAFSLAACLVTQHIGFIVDPATGELQGVVIPSVWDFNDPSELDLFRASLPRLDIELTNANLNATTGDITIALLDDSGSVITSNPFGYVIDTSDEPFRLRISSVYQWIATFFVRGLAGNTAAAGVIFEPELELQAIDDSQPVEICVDIHYNNVLLDDECAVWPPMN